MNEENKKKFEGLIEIILSLEENKKELKNEINAPEDIIININRGFIPEGYIHHVINNQLTPLYLMDSETPYDEYYKKVNIIFHNLMNFMENPLSIDDFFVDRLFQESKERKKLDYVNKEVLQFYGSLFLVPLYIYFSNHSDENYVRDTNNKHIISIIKDGNLLHQISLPDIVNLTAENFKNFMQNYDLMEKEYISLKEKILMPRENNSLNTTKTKTSEKIIKLYEKIKEIYLINLNEKKKDNFNIIFNSIH